jgi:transcriptional regulator with XRE-family HTH domain
MKRLAIDYEKLVGASYSRQSELAKKLGVTQPTISRWVKGTIRLSLDDLNRVATALERHTTDFVVEIDDEDNEN